MSFASIHLTLSNGHDDREREENSERQCPLADVTKFGVEIHSHVARFCSVPNIVVSGVFSRVADLSICGVAREMPVKKSEAAIAKWDRHAAPLTDGKESQCG